MINLTGGFDAGLVEAIKKYDSAYPGRFYTFTEPSYSLFLNPNYPRLQAEAIEQAHNNGTRGLKILKTLGLYLRSNITSGTLVKTDDPRFDSMWDTCGQLNMPVAIHVSDPVAFSRRRTASMRSTKSSAIIRTGLSTATAFPPALNY